MARIRKTQNQYRRDSAVLRKKTNQHHEDVAIILKKGTENWLIEWKPINSRFIKIRWRGRYFNMTVVQCCAPTLIGMQKLRFHSMTSYKLS